MNLGFIGAGNMAGALIRGVVMSESVKAENVHVFDISDVVAKAYADSLGVNAHDALAQMIDQSDMIVVAVKPNVVKSVLVEHKAALANKAVISIAAGWTTQMLCKRLDASTRILRVMPNTPALCSQGMTAMSMSNTLTDEERGFVEMVFSALGRAQWVKEEQMEAVIGISGSSPAYVYMFIEALSDAGVLLGLPRHEAIMMAAQAVKGAAEMVLTTGAHPGALKDNVCSPGGTTIAAVRELERQGMRAAVIDAAVCAAEKAREMSEK